MELVDKGEDIRYKKLSSIYVCISHICKMWFYFDAKMKLEMTTNFSQVSQVFVMIYNSINIF